MVYEVFERLKQYEWEEPDYSDFLEQFYAMHKEFDTNKTNVIQAVSKKIDRNEPCPCGSGKKYKKCCGK